MSARAFAVLISFMAIANAAEPDTSYMTQETYPVVETTHGKVRGRVDEGIANFRGIPYGGHVDGARRFMAPLPPDNWTGIHDAIKTGPRAVQEFGNLFQTLEGEYIGGGRINKMGLNDQKDDENCLVLNVLTPHAGPGKRPVMVYIHGGGFWQGSSVIGVAASGLPRDEDVVLVSVNHRLNVFGYLYLGGLDSKYADSGNAGQLDLILALQWVRDNIAAFGGNPSNVTLFGESGGGMKISTLLAMPAARGLFERAIIESGSGLTAASAEQATASTREVLKKLKLKDSQLAELTRMPARALFDAIGPGGFRFRPVIDGKNLTHSPFEPGAPPESAGVPLIIGYTEQEESWLMGNPDESLFHLDEYKARERLTESLKLTRPQVDAIVDAYRQHHVDDNWSDTFFRIVSDAGFGLNSTLQAERKVRAADAKVFKYLFTYNTPFEGGKFKARHAGELPMVMRLVKYPESEQLSRRMAAAWAAFARTGDPSQPGLTWPAYTLEKRATMVFDLTSRVADDPAGNDRNLWFALPAPPQFRRF
jgi:para-nitrobenzyl esterase